MKLVWDDTGRRIYETGVQNGVLYPRAAGGTYPNGVAWNGLINVTESPTGAEATPVYADNIKYLNLMTVEEFGATVEAYTYPDEFVLCDGSAALANGVYIGQQPRQPFGMAYKTVVGNDVDLNEHGYKIHLIYGAQASPSEKAYATINDSPEAITFSWELTTTPVTVSGQKPTASLTIDSTKAEAGKMAALELILFGSENANPRLPLPDEVSSIFTGSVPGALTLISIVPADNSTDISVNTPIVLTFNNSISQEAIIIVTEDGNVVTGIKTWDANRKILTFAPTLPLVANTLHLVTIAGVADVYNQSLTPIAKNFTTA